MQDIQFGIPIEIDLNKSDSEEKRRIRGYASTPDEDRQGESLVQKGLDISDFINHGWFNYDHDNTKILGYPDKNDTKVTSKGLYVEGELLKGVPLADDIWNIAVALKKSGSDRQLGFSVEGKVIAKNPNGSILKAKVYNVAITPNPVNTSATWEALCKSFVSIDKSLDTGGYTQAQCVAFQENGSALQGESLEGGIYNQLSSSFITIGNFLDTFGSDAFRSTSQEVQDLLNTSKISKGVMITYLQVVKGLSRQQAEEVYSQYY